MMVKSVMCIPSPPPTLNELAEVENLARTLPLNSPRQMIVTIYSALGRLFFQIQLLDVNFFTAESQPGTSFII